MTTIIQRLAKLQKIDDEKCEQMHVAFEAWISDHATKEEQACYLRWLMSPYWVDGKPDVQPNECKPPLTYEQARAVQAEVGLPQEGDCEILAKMRERMPDHIASDFAFVLEHWKAPHDNWDWLRKVQA